MKASEYVEKYRPQYHFSPPSNWMNDPNGMVYYEGEYHLFYQHHPQSTIWGPMHWGHAVSTDLIHWQHLPVALAPDHNGMIFSGSAVVDAHDSSGFFDGGSGLVAIFTHHDTVQASETAADAGAGTTSRTRQRQSLAYSTDKGRTWTMYAGNPVLSDESIVDFRDPKVFWHAESSRWVMVLAAGDHVRFYTSPNLREWTFASEFGKTEGSHDGVWECPDLFELPVDGHPHERKWVLLVSIGDSPDCPEGSRTQYFVGDFNGESFSSDLADDEVIWMDEGRDNYAGVTWSDVPAEDGRRLLIGWMSNWKYANFTPTTSWRSAMTVPRVLTLKRTDEGIRLYQQPVQELSALREAPLGWSALAIGPDRPQTIDWEGKAFELEAEFELAGAAEFGLKLRKSGSEETVVGYDAALEKLFIDRTASGESAFSPAFAVRHDAALKPDGGRIKLHIFVDWSSVEVFAGGGRAVMSDLIFPDDASQGVELYAVEGQVKLISMKIYPLASIYSRQAVSAGQS
ncbi:glycoside hydrolase [Paenibacillus beijingensis]|uniref:Glycoside hydrolase n=2 Tax=Paenibacillus beijingensis TaxID=1126833 RepID=A0A0D5NRI2_9BACL|nr:glycoside hydrolase [Paenibacillus beijingensis]